MCLVDLWVAKGGDRYELEKVVAESDGVYESVFRTLYDLVIVDYLDYQYKRFKINFFGYCNCVFDLPEPSPFEERDMELGSGCAFLEYQMRVRRCKDLKYGEGLSAIRERHTSGELTSLFIFN